IFFHPAGVAGMSGNRLSVGTTLIAAHGSFTDDFLGTSSDLKNPVIPVPNIYITHQINPKFTAGIGLYAPYGLETKWDPNNFSGRFLGYNTDVRSIYLQPTVWSEISPRLKLSDRLSIGGHWITRKTIKYNGTAKFVPEATHLFVPATIGTCPTCVPAGTPVDALLAAEFGTNGPLSNGSVSTSIVMPPQGSLGFAYK